MNHLKKYFQKIPENKQQSSAIAILAGLDHISQKNPKIAATIIQELQDQRSNLKLIASENFCSLSVQLAMGNWLTDKYSEGFPHHRFYAGCENIDSIEDEAVNRLKKIFQCDHAYVQPHSGADANLIAYFSILIHRVQNRELEKIHRKLDELNPEQLEHLRKIFSSQRLLGMSLRSGGHLTHGYLHNISSKMMQSFSYDVNPVTHQMDYAALAIQAKEVKPTILVAGYSAYPRLIDFSKMREIADSVGATLLVDMAHFAGLVAGKALSGVYNPIPFADVVTSTTHKTMRGPRGGIILCKKEFSSVIDKGCPYVLGGPLPHVIAAKAIAFQEAATEEFSVYARQILLNAKALAASLIEAGCRLITGGTDNHIIVMDVRKSFGLTGRVAEQLLRRAHITVNRNTIPFDSESPWNTSGIRLGTPALTTLGMKENEMSVIADHIVYLLKNAKQIRDGKFTVDEQILQRIQKEISMLLQQFPLYPEIIL